MYRSSITSDRVGDWDELNLFLLIRVKFCHGCKFSCEEKIFRIEHLTYLDSNVLVFEFVDEKTSEENAICFERIFIRRRMENGKKIIGDTNYNAEIT